MITSAILAASPLVRPNGLIDSRFRDRTVQEQGATITRLRKDFEKAIAQQQKQIETLTATVKEQASQIQKVSAHLEVSKAAPQTVNNP